MPERPDPSTRARILDTALELFSRQGYGATTTRQITDLLDITPAALYYHFPSKLHVLEGIVEPYLSDIEELLARYATADTSTAGAKRALLREYLTIMLAAPLVADLVGRERELDQHPELGPRIDAAVAAMGSRLVAPSDDPAALLRAAAALGALRRPVLRPEVDVGAQTEELLDAVMAALGP